MKQISQLLPNYSKYLEKHSDPIKKMGSKKKGKVLVGFLKAAMNQDWKNNGEVRSCINRSIAHLKKKKEKNKLSSDAKKKFKVLSKTFKSKLEAYTNAFQAAPPEAIKTEEKLGTIFLNRIAACPVTNKLYQEALAVQKANFERGKSLTPSLKFLVVEKHPTGYVETDGSFLAQADSWFGRIYLVKKSDEETMLTLAVFELCNIKRQEQFNDAWDRAKKGIIKNAEDFAHEYEIIEHGSNLEHHQVLLCAIAQHGWSTSQDWYKNTPTDPEKHWQQVKNTRHADCYRGYYNSLHKV